MNAVPRRPELRGLVLYDATRVGNAMKIKQSLSIALLAGAKLTSAAGAQQNLPPGATMLVPGVYTTPEISAKCQAFAAKRVPSNDATNSRQAVALACAKKLWNQQFKGQPVKGTRG